MGVVKAIHRLALLALFICGSCYVESTEAQNLEQRIVERPKVLVGDTWVYSIKTTNSKDGDYLVTSVVSLVNDTTIFTEGTAKYSDRLDAEVRATYTLDWNLKLVGIQVGTILKPHQGLYRFPLKMGDSYDSVYEAHVADKNGPGSVLLYKRITRAVRWETVTVPAGTFLAVVLQSDGTIENVNTRWSDSSNWTYWYVPEVRRFVKGVEQNGQTRREIELVSFRLVQ